MNEIEFFKSYGAENHKGIICLFICKRDVIQGQGYCLKMFLKVSATQATNPGACLNKVFLQPSHCVVWQAPPVNTPLTSPPNL